jgi:hypothetical protein
VGGKELILEQGDNIRGKISRDDVAELCVRSLEQSKARNITLEVKSGENIANDINWQQLFSHLQPD